MNIRFILSRFAGKWIIRKHLIDISTESICMRLTISKQDLLTLVSIIIISFAAIDPFNILNELRMVILLFLILLLSRLQFKRDFLKALGFRKEALTPKNVIVFAPLIALLLTQLYEFVFTPILLGRFCTNWGLKIFWF